MEKVISLQTDRLLLRPFTENDAEALFSLLRDEEVTVFLPMFPLKNLEEAKRYLNKHYLNQDRGLHFAICLQPDNFPIGYISVSGDDSHDFGYALQKEYWHQGIVTEASLAVVQFAKNTGIPYLTATHDINNPRSGAVMQKIGMTYRYSYEEQWQPKDFPVIFRMYQINFDGQNGRIYRKYWDKYPHHFMEQID